MKRIVLLVLGMAVGWRALAQVRVYEETITMPTWEIGPAQVHSVFADAGNQVYPYTLRETLTDRRVSKSYRGVFLENEYIKLLVLPEIGGRLHGALDKTNGFEWFYWHKSIKPGLISMTGAWISGGIEWNFPHGHRPSCFLPVDYRIVRNQDGSATVWVGETEPIFRLRWLVGMTVFPGRSYLRCDYVLVNPTNHRHSFMFWATSATYAHELVQAMYPGDMVTGHGKREFWNWPIHNGVDLTWWKNSFNASSYFAFNNPSEWFGTYDHKAQAGMVHVANHWIMPGKKLWTWGSGPSGRIWDDILSDGAGPYFEPQAGAFSDNQPDYHWMAPGEVKLAHDYWYPVRDIRGFHNASKDFAINTDLRDGQAFAGVYATSAVSAYRIVLKNAKTGQILHTATPAISPARPFTVQVKVPPETTVYDLHLAVYGPDGKLALELQQQPPKQVPLPEGLKEPGDPTKMTQDELYHAGEWLDRFRRAPEALQYYQEALRRDPGDARVNAEMGFLALKRGAWEEALSYLERALKRDSDNARLYFGRALAYQGLGKNEQAYDDFYRASYGAELFSAANLNLARMDMARGDFRAALDKLAQAARQNAALADIRALEAAAWRHVGERTRALEAAELALSLDPLHYMAGYEKTLLSDDPSWRETWQKWMREDPQNYLELATAYGAAGLYREACDVLDALAAGRRETELHPMVSYLAGYYKELAGDPQAARHLYARAARGPTAYTNPHRLEEEAALRAALTSYPADAHAHLFLGNLLYALGRRKEGFQHWQRASQLDEHLPPAWRNVAYALRYLEHDLKGAYQAYRKAADLDPGDARVLLELDQVAEALRMAARDRLAFLEQRLKAVEVRDDLVARLVDLWLEAGGRENLAKAYQTLKTRHFHSWEGRYGIHYAWVEVNQKLGDLALAGGDFAGALAYYKQSGEYPANLEVAPRTPDFRAHVNWKLASAYLAQGNQAAARAYLESVLGEKYRRVHLGAYYQALALKALGREAEYRKLLGALEAEALRRVSGQFEYRGSAERIGRYLLALVLEEKGEREKAQAELARALEQEPRVARLALREAQLDFARAHQ